MNELWLVRNEKNWIAGPYPREHLKQLILSGKVSPRDEVCAANQHWFNVSDERELWSRLGIHVPGGTAGALREEETETDTVWAPTARTSEVLLPPAPENTRRVESPTFFRGLTWALVAFLLFLLTMILRMFRNSGAV